MVNKQQYNTIVHQMLRAWGMVIHIIAVQKVRIKHMPHVLKAMKYTQLNLKIYYKECLVILTTDDPN